MNTLKLTFLLLSLSFLTACSEKNNSQDEEASSQKDLVSSTVTIDGETTTFSYTKGQCMNPFGKGITAIVSNEKLMFELEENSRTGTWRMHYNIPLGDRKYLQHRSISLDIMNENNILKGSGIVKQNNKPEIKHNIAFRIDCTKDLK